MTVTLVDTLHWFNTGKRAFSAAAPGLWNQLPVATKSSETIATSHKKNICLKLIFYHTFSAAPCANDDFCLSPFMIVPNDFVCCASEVEFSRICNVPLLNIFLISD